LGPEEPMVSERASIITVGDWMGDLLTCASLLCSGSEHSRANTPISAKCPRLTSAAMRGGPLPDGVSPGLRYAGVVLRVHA
jgi:hypothetical protein